METTPEDYIGRARREAAAILDNRTIDATRNGIIDLMAMAWIQGRIGGIHTALGTEERAFQRLQEDLR
jgi:hypothetical protein